MQKPLSIKIPLASLILFLTFQFNCFAQDKQEIQLQLVDAVSQQNIPFISIKIIELNAAKDSVYKDAVSDENGKLKVMIASSLFIRPFNSNFTNELISVERTQNTTEYKLYLNPSYKTLAEVIVKDQTIYDANKIEYRIKKPIDQEAPITKNFIKTMPGVSKLNEKYNYLGRSILYYLDGISSSDRIIEETLTESLEKVEVILSPTSQFWMKPGEVIFNFITKKIKEPKIGLNLNSSLGLMMPYFYSNLNFYHLDKKFNYRISSIFYNYRNNNSNSLNQEYGNEKSGSTSDKIKKVTPNFNTFLFNYFIDSTTTLTYEFLYNKINYLTNASINYFPFSTKSTNNLQAESQSDSQENEIGNWLMLKRKSKLFSIHYITKRNKRMIQLNKGPSGNQSIDYKTSEINLNFNDEKALKNGAMLSYNLSSENIYSSSLFSTNTSEIGQSIFSSNFWGLKTNFQKTVNQISYTIGGRIDYIQQKVETVPTSALNKIEKMIFLPTFSVNLSNEKLGNFILAFNKDYTIPEIRNLSKFTSQSDPFNTYNGSNSLINEQSMEASLYHFWQNDKLNLSSDISYAYVYDQLGYAPIVYNNSLLEQTYANIGGSKKLKFHVDFSFPISSKISTQFSYYSTFVNYYLNENFQFNTFDNGWNNFSSYSTNTTFLLSKRIESSLNLSYTNYDYDFFSKTRYYFPEVTLNLDINMGHDWYGNMSWNTIFKNANTSTENTNHPNFQSSSFTNRNFSNFEIGLRKIFGNKVNTVRNDNEYNEVKRNIQKN